MGTSASTSDEWIELFNISDQAVDLTGWSIKNQENDFEVLLEGFIEPQQYFLLERTDDSTVSDISADCIYTGSLNNSGEVLFLSDGQEQIADEIDGWHAGDNATKATMERVDFGQPGTSPENWCTNNQAVINGLDADGNPIFGTPRESNSCGTPAEDPPEDPPDDPEDEIPTLQLIINEVMVGSEVNPEKDDWIELYNPNDEKYRLRVAAAGRYAWRTVGLTSQQRNMTPSSLRIFFSYPITPTVPLPLWRSGLK